MVPLKNAHRAIGTDEIVGIRAAVFCLSGVARVQCLTSPRWPSVASTQKRFLNVRRRFVTEQRRFADQQSRPANVQRRSAD
ncbi:MAG: hypothetical protein M3O50_07785 [Myxococcota bacterium]|nr:hypothetical protein [Myxococcota bacterium]